ncbi:MAG: hypothetical protein HQL69_07270 [Magnetococcales bacterium]|nr:hypothetical protein [Magnetococcales bacterium]
MSQDIYPDSVATTWNISLSKLAKESIESVNILIKAARKQLVDFLADGDI